MSDIATRQILALGKVIIAAAWADGKVTDEEINSLKDILFQLPSIGLQSGAQLSGMDWSRLQMYIESPIDEAEQVRLVAELGNTLRSEQHRRFVGDALRQLIEADGKITPEEETEVARIKKQLAAVDVSFIGQLGRLIGEAINRRSEMVKNAPNREEQFGDFIRNKVYYGVQRRLKENGRSLKLADADLRKFCLAGGLMAQIAYADRRITEEEADAIPHLLVEKWGVNEETAVFITEVALSDLGYSFDYYRLIRQFSENSSRDERFRFLKLLFAVAAADGLVTNEEIEEIRNVARGFNLEHKLFIDAKLSIPREKRAS